MKNNLNFGTVGPFFREVSLQNEWFGIALYCRQQAAKPLARQKFP